ncbi:MAG TPA: hypothetical protein VLM11_18980 [Streptosporangiaceae bacterium]|nr:hypothetical protein [Streptosporangiaceae bacterium]
MIRQLRRSAVALVAAGAMLAGLTACGTPAYTYATDSADQTYFKVPSSWPQASPLELLHVQLVLGITPSGTDGTFTWVRAYDAAIHPSPIGLLIPRTPVVYASVQDMKSSLRAALSFDQMRNLLFPVTPAARHQAAAAGVTFTGFNLLINSTITTKYGVRGINELYEFSVRGQPVYFDQTALTNSSTTKLYLLLVECDQKCFGSNLPQIKTVVQSFTVRGS